MRISDWSSDVCSSDLISKQLKEAEALRLDAESLKAEYEAKLADAAKEADEMRARADSEAEALVAKAKADATALITRRKQMAEDRIAAAEAGALAEVRTAAATGCASCREREFPYVSNSGFAVPIQKKNKQKI